MDPQDVLLALGISLGLGLLVGLQREYAAVSLAGIRTFPLLTLFGTVCGLIAQSTGTLWLVAAGALALAALLVAGHFTKARTPDDPHPGITTEVAALLMYGLGAYLTFGSPGDGHLVIATALGVVVAVLLQLKQPMHSFVRRLGETDIKAIMQFVVIALVILPLLPNRTYDWYHVLNPREIWLVVVLIVSISLIGYVIFKLLGQRVGLLLGGILGGVISSTATTVSYARRTLHDAAASYSAALVILIATTVSLVRLMLEISAVGREQAAGMLPPLGAMLGFMIAICAVAYFFGPRASAGLAPKDNPAELKGAIIFGLLYALMRFGAAAAKTHLPGSWLYGLAVVSGWVDIDALTLSSAGMVREQTLSVDTAWRLVLTAFLSNLAFKSVMILILGSRRLLWQATALFAVTTAGGLALMLFWQ